MNDRDAKREIKSFWWVPGHPETRWFGTLTLERAQSHVLELIAQRTNLFDTPSPLAGVIHGHDEQGVPITLRSLIPLSRHSTNALVKYSFQVGYALNLDFSPMN